VSLAELKEVSHGYGCTLNDVVLCVLSGAYRELLKTQGDHVAHAHVRSLVPVSVRIRDARASYDNRLSAVLCDLPVRIANPLERLHSISAQMTRLKQAHMVEAGVWFTHIADFVPPLLVGAVSRKAARIMHQHPQRMISTVTTNVPGPRQPLYMLGRRLLHWMPHVPITQGARLGSACLSYANELAFGITADYASIADLTVFTKAIADDLAALLGGLRARGSTTPEHQ
jgi:diacylglycerol O-acyltransferase